MKVKRINLKAFAFMVFTVLVIASCNTPSPKISTIQFGELANGTNPFAYEIQFFSDTSRHDCSMEYHYNEAPKSAKISCSTFDSLAQMIEGSGLPEAIVINSNKRVRPKSCTILIRFENGTFKMFEAEKSAMPEAYSRIYNYVKSVFEYKAKDLVTEKRE